MMCVTCSVSGCPVCSEFRVYSSLQQQTDLALKATPSVSGCPLERISQMSDLSGVFSHTQKHTQKQGAPALKRHRVHLSCETPHFRTTNTPEIRFRLKGCPPIKSACNRQRGWYRTGGLLGNMDSAINALHVAEPELGAKAIVRRLGAQHPSIDTRTVRDSLQKMIALQAKKESAREEEKEEEEQAAMAHVTLTLTLALTLTLTLTLTPTLTLTRKRRRTTTRTTTSCR